MKVLALSFLVLAASAAPAPDCPDGQCSCILPVVIMPGGGPGAGATGGLLNNLLLGGLLNGGLVNIGGGGGGGLLGNLLGGLLGGRRPAAAAGQPLYRFPNGDIVPDFAGGRFGADRIGDTSGLLNNALLEGIANNGLINSGRAGEAALAYGSGAPLFVGNTDGALNNLAPRGILNGGAINV